MPRNVALAFNLIHEDQITSTGLDRIAELDSEETIEALKTALEAGGHRVTLVEADEHFPEKIANLKGKIDIVFNIAEGLRGESRESFVPQTLEMLGIPYTGSGPLTLSLCLNKARTKEILHYYGIPTAEHQVMTTGDEPLSHRLHFPLFVKLTSEGSSIGLTYDSICEDEAALRRQVRKLVDTYRQSVLVEEYLDGREFTIPLLENPPRTLPIIEIRFFGEKPINVFIPDKKYDAFDKHGYEMPVQKTEAVCPAVVDAALETRLLELAVSAYNALSCRDWCRLEIRLDRNGNPHVLELNPIAGIDPSYWFPRSAKVAGMDYAALINTILNSALKRHGMLH